MKKSQFIAIVVMFVAASVLIWIGAFSKISKDAPTDDTLKGTIAPAETAAPTATPEEEATPTPETEETPEVTETPAPTATPAPEKVVFPTISNADFANYKNDFTYFSSRFVTGEGNQNIPYLDPNIESNIGNADYIFLNDTSETEWEVYLTFTLNYEDGYTEKILDTLKTYNVKAVFFVSYDYISQNQTIVKRMVEEGHKIGSRGPISENVISSCTAEQFAEEMLKIEKEYQLIFGDTQRITLYRPDYFSARTLAVAEALGYQVVFRTYTTISDEKDWNSSNANANTVFTRLWERGTYDGSVPEFTCDKRICDVLPQFLKETTESGITFKLLEKKS